MENINLAKGDIPPYLCSLCNEPVFLIEDRVYKPCAHTDAPVLANISATAYGAGSAKS